MITKEDVKNYIKELGEFDLIAYEELDEDGCIEDGVQFAYAPKWEVSEEQEIVLDNSYRGVIRFIKRIYGTNYTEDLFELLVVANMSLPLHKVMSIIEYRDVQWETTED